MYSSHFQCQACGRVFSGPGPLNYHARTCSKSKKQVQGVLARAHEVWAARKKRRIHASIEDLLPLHDAPNVAPVAMEATSGVSPVAEAALGQEVEPTRGGIVAQPALPLISNNDPPAEASEADNLSIAQRKARRVEVKAPKRFPDIIPSATPAFLQRSKGEALAPAPTSRRLLRFFETPRNIFGLRRKYFSTEPLTHDPDEWTTLSDIYEPSEPTESNSAPPTSPEPSFDPYPNRSSFSLGEWYWNDGVQKSQKNFKDLVDIIAAPDFNTEEIRKTNWASVNKKLGGNYFDDDDRDEWEDVDAGWMRTEVSINVPFHSRMKVPGSQQAFVGDLYHRSIVSVIQEKLSIEADDAYFHYEPYALSWQPNTKSRKIRIHGELYTSPSFEDAHRDLQKSPGEPGCNLARVVVALMFWSDATHLTSFGTSQLWPMYLGFGNESKYRRCKPSLNLMNHIAYFHTLPDSFKDFVARNVGGNGPTDAFMLYCRREAFHAQLAIIFDSEFINAYKHGIVIKCCDGITRRFYPRMFTYSADYPEKVFLASIRKMGDYPCPRCLVPKANLKDMGTEEDMANRISTRRVDDSNRRRKIKRARDFIYAKGQPLAVNGTKVEELLKSESLVPTLNTFSARFEEFNFNFFSMFVVDLLHEFEIGVWKRLYMHLIRMLDAYNAALINELDLRYRNVATFGRDKIRKFSSNSSEMKRLAARDYEDLLQCAIPVFDGLLPEPYNKAVMDLLFSCAYWHALAKLRMHTDQTLALLDTATASLSQQFRLFQENVCPNFNTREFQREADARSKRKAKKGESTTTGHATRRVKTLDMNTYKYHALGDYADTIRKYGTADLISTEPGELEHRTPKGRYPRTDRRIFVKQLAQIERRQARIRRIRAQNSDPKSDGNKRREASLVAITPEVHHSIGKTENFPEHVGLYTQTNAADLAFYEFIPKLKQHLLPRIKAYIFNDTQDLPANSGGDWQGVLFKRDRVYRHNIMRINYTTYDVRRAEDVIHPKRSHRDVIVLNPSYWDGDLDAHPFHYARVLGIYHANVMYIGEGNRDYTPHRLEFLHVRWFEMDDTLLGGWSSLRLDRVQLRPATETGSFGFLDPADVLRGSHLVSAFSQEKPCMGSAGASDNVMYYVNRFVDRDMVMRYLPGLGVGHTYAHGMAINPHGNTLDSTNDGGMGEDDRDGSEAGGSGREADMTSKGKDVEGGDEPMADEPGCEELDGDEDEEENKEMDEEKDGDEGEEDEDEDEVFEYGSDSNYTDNESVVSETWEY